MKSKNRLFTLLFLIVVILFISTAIFKAGTNNKNTSLSYKDTNGESVGIGYSYVVGDDKYPNSNLYFISELTNVDISNNNVYAEFIINSSSGKDTKQKFILFNDGIAKQKFYLHKIQSNSVIPGAGEQLIIKSSNDVVKSLKPYIGKAMILHLSFKDPADFSGQYIPFLKCNEIFYEAYSNKSSTQSCYPYIYDISIYIP